MVTIFSFKISGLTSIAKGMSPVDVMGMLNYMYIEADKLVDKHKLYKVEIAVDACMVLGCAPN